jgi:hypothetical protein
MAPDREGAVVSDDQGVPYPQGTPPQGGPGAQPPFPQQPAPQYPPQQPSYPPQQPYPGQPAAAPQQPYAGQPAAPPQQPYAGQPAAPVQPPKKKRGLAIALSVIGLLLVCGVGSCAAVIGFGVLGNSGGDKDAATQAEAHFDAARSAVETASTSLDGAASSEKATKEAANAAEKSLRTARDEIAASRAAIERASAGKGRTDYVAALEDATRAVDGLEDVVAYVRVMSSMAAQMKEAGTAGSKANDDLNAAIEAGNASRYGVMKTKAQAAASGYVRAAGIFRQAHELDTAAGLDKAAQFAEKRKAQADVVIRMAQEGSAGKVSAYNRDIQTQKRLGQEADAIGDPPIITDSNWLDKRLSVLQKSVTEAGDRSDQLRATALQELGLTD